MYESELEVTNLESTIKKLIVQTDLIFSAQEDIGERQTYLAELVKSLAQPGRSDYALAGIEFLVPISILANGLNQMADTFLNIEKSRQMLIEQTRDIFVEPLNQFTIKVLNPMKKSGKEFSHARDIYESALSKYMGKPANNSAESAQEVGQARKILHIKTLEYCLKLNNLDSRRNFELLEHIVALCYTQFAFYHQGFEWLKELEPHLRSLTDSFSILRKEHAALPDSQEKSLASKLKKDEIYNPMHGLSPDKSMRSTKLQNLQCIPTKCGYLFKKSAGSIRSSWNRRFFELKNDALQYTSDAKDELLVIIDLRICMVREVATPERKFSFEILSPSKFEPLIMLINRSFILQAENEYDKEAWVTILQGAITRCLQGDPRPSFGTDPSDGSSTSPGQTDFQVLSVSTIDVLTQLQSVDGNSKCADCSDKENVDWASCNLGILLCITCSGIHRGLGRQFSKIRSLELDRWDQSTIDFMRDIGNEISNKIFECALNPVKADVKKPTATSSQQEREAFARKKYIDRAFVRLPGDDRKLIETPAQSMFTSAVRDSQLTKALRAIALGADVNSKDLIGQTCLHLSVLKSDTRVADFLMHWNCDVNCADRDGKTDRGDSNMVTLLLKRNAKCKVEDAQQRKPIDYALAKSTSGEEYVKIVTILRLTLLNKETRNATTWRTSMHRTIFIILDDLGIEEALQDLKSRPLSGGGTGKEPAFPAYPGTPTANRADQRPLQRVPIVPAFAPDIARSSFEKDDQYSAADNLENFVPDHFKSAGQVPAATFEGDPWASARWS